MRRLSVPGAEIAYRVAGSGPPLLLPECNFTWDPGLVDLMAQTFTVMVASPRDFGASSRPGGPYNAGAWASDLHAVAAHLGHERFLVFGYSFTGAFGPWLAQRLAHERSVIAVASGGFPLLGDYGITSREVDAQLEQARQDPVLWAKYNERFDLLAGAEFYRELARLPADGLVDDMPCPLYCFWGDRDTDAIEVALPHHVLAEGLTHRGVPWRQYPGYDHEGLHDDLAVAWPATEAWLMEQAKQDER